MAIKSDAEIYKILEKHIRESTEPLTCVALHNFADVAEHARSAEKVSDFLGLMWRRGLLQRWQAPVTSTDRSRYAYSWKDNPSGDKPQLVHAVSLVNTTRRKSNVTITEEADRIVLDFDKFTLIVQAKP
jgi:hypothetical protein